MALPSIKLHGAKQCTAKSKRTGLPCQNPAAYGCSTCRIHGSRKPENIKRGKEHPNYKHGKRSLETIKEYKKSMREIKELSKIARKYHLIK